MSRVGQRSDARSVAARAILTAFCMVVVAAGDTSGQIECGTRSPRVGAALARIGKSVDPCGESAQIRALLARLEQCSRQHYRYQVCIDTSAERNVFDQPAARNGEAPIRTITWNPRLRTELESSCDGDPSRIVRRDPAASLLHELVHAVQDCDGLNPGENELEAVRIENIYRRAAGLCQRTGYGARGLPPDQRKLCNAAGCSCRAPTGSPGGADLVRSRGDGRLHGDRPAD